MRLKLNIDNENMPDIMVTKYKVIEDENNDDISFVTLSNDNTIKGTYKYDNTKNDFKFKPFTIRIYFEWYEGNDEKMDDESDTNLIKENTKAPFTINSTIKFSQEI